jgi:hypothetical protein
MERTPYPKLEYERQLVLHNPGRSQADDSKHERFYEQFIADQKIPAEHIFEKPREVGALQDLLGSRLHEGDVVHLFSGDGGYNDYVTAQCGDDVPEVIRQVPVHLMGGGNGNDAVRGFVKRSDRGHPSILLDNSWVATYNPIRCVVENLDDNRQAYYAASYIGFNVTGEAMAIIDSQTHRSDPQRAEAGRAKTRWIDSKAVIYALRHGQEFKAENDDEVRKYYERLFANGSKMAGIGSLPVRFSEPRLYEIDIKDKGVATVAANLGALAAHSLLRTRLIRPRGQYVAGPVSFRIPESIAWQRDGNPDRLLAGSRVTISRATDYVLHVVSNRKRP